MTRVALGTLVAVVAVAAMLVLPNGWAAVALVAAAVRLGR